MATAKKKPVAKKATAKKPATKKPTAKKPVAKKTTAKKTPVKKPTAKTATTALSLAKLQELIRRPDQTLPPPKTAITLLIDDLLVMVNFLNTFAANLRALDRQRHNGVGLRRLGFIEAAFRLSSKFPQYFPHWLNTAKFQRDLDLFNTVRSLVEVCRSLEEKAWNINVEAADMVFTDALEYYSQVQDAAERRIDSAESIYNELNEFFKAHGNRGNCEPTQAEQERDAKALIKGKKDGKMILENRKPKITAGEHKVIDETFKDSAAFKETEDAQIQD